jgi:uncharacterized protein (DUF2236 family)
MVTAINESAHAPAFSADLAAALTPDSVAWRKASDFRGFLLAGRALVLQVSYPTVANGVREHSDYQSDPWSRLMRTLDFLQGVLYSDDPESVAAGMRAMHKKIKGTAPDGTQYHALEPEAFTWVHSTLVESMVAVHDAFGRPLTSYERERFYAEMRGIGGLYGVRERDLPEDWNGFMEYYDWMVEERLGDNDVVQGVLETIATPARPLRQIPRGVWRAAFWPASRALWVGTVGWLPARLREKLGVSLTPGDRRLMGVMRGFARGIEPIMPERLKVFGPSYLKLRERYGPPAQLPAG